MSLLYLLHTLLQLTAQTAVVSIMTNFTGVTLPQQVTYIPVRYRIDNGQEQVQNVPLNCGTSVCTGEVVVFFESVRHAATFQVTRSTNPPVAFPLALLQDHHNLAAGTNHGLVLRNGQVWSYGQNDQGQLGYGYKGDGFHSKLRKIPGLSRIASVYAGTSFSVALDSSGDVWTWGSNQYGKLGNGFLDPQGTYPGYYTSASYNGYFSDPTPRKVVSGKKVFNISVGDDQVFVVDSSGNVWGWGCDNGVIKVPSSQTMISSPTQLSWVSNVRSIHFGADRRYGAGVGMYVIAIGWDGAMKAYGNPYNGVLGSSPGVNTPNTWAPSTSGLGSFVGPVTIQTGTTHLLLEYVKSDNGEHVVMGMGQDNVSNYWNGTLYTPYVLSSGTLNGMEWSNESVVRRVESAGRNNIEWKGRFLTSYSALQTWSTLTDSQGVALSSDGHSMGMFQCLLREAGTGNIWAWGLDFAVSGGVASIPVGIRRIDFDSSVRSPATIAVRTVLSGVVLPPQIKQIPIEYTVDGGVIKTAQVPLNCTSTLCTGTIQHVDSRGTASVTFQVTRSTSPNAKFPLALKQDRHTLAAGANHGLVLRNGQVWSYGQNDQGQLGYGYKGDGFHSKLRRIPGLSRIASVYAGTSFSVALDSSGDVWTWGSNQYGKLGNGFLDPKGTFPGYYTPAAYNGFYSDPVPRKVVSGKKVFNVSVGDDQVFVVDSSGNVWGWGCDNGVIKVPSSQTMISSPTQLSWASNVRSIHFGADRRYGAGVAMYVIALSWDGTMKAYGNPYNGVLGSSPGVNIPNTWAPSISGLGSFVGPVGIQTGTTHLLLEYIRPENGEHVVIGLGADNVSLFWNDTWSTPSILSTGTLGEIEWSNESVVRRFVSAGRYNAEWKGRFLTSYSALQTWTTLNDSQGVPLASDGHSMGMYQCLLREAGTGNIWAWGLDFAVSGGSASIPVGIRRIEFDDGVGEITLPEIEGDSIILPFGIDSLTVRYRVGLDSGNLIATLQCSDSGKCYTNMVARLQNGSVRGKMVLVQRRKMLLSDFQTGGIPSCHGCQSFTVQAPIPGRWSVRIYRLDQGEILPTGYLELGTKSSLPLAASWSSEGNHPPLHDGVYAAQWIWSGFGKRDSISTSAIKSTGYMLEPFKVNHNYTIAILAFPSWQRRFVSVLTRVYGEGDSGLTLLSGAVVDSTSGSLIVPSILQKEEVPFQGGVPLQVRSWYMDGIFQIDSSGPISSFSVTNRVYDPTLGAVSEVQWTTDGADSARVDVIDSSGTRNTNSQVLAGRVLLDLPYDRYDRMNGVVLRVYRDGMCTKKILPVMGMTKPKWGL